MRLRKRIALAADRVAVPWSAFRLGYVTALDDVERTGLRPMREHAKEDAARRAYRHLLGVNPSNQEHSDG